MWLFFGRTHVRNERVKLQRTFTWGTSYLPVLAMVRGQVRLPFSSICKLGDRRQRWVHFRVYADLLKKRCCSTPVAQLTTVCVPCMVGGIMCTYIFRRMPCVSVCMCCVRVIAIIHDISIGFIFSIRRYWHRRVDAVCKFVCSYNAIIMWKRSNINIKPTSSYTLYTRWNICVY